MFRFNISSLLSKEFVRQYSYCGDQPISICVCIPIKWGPAYLRFVMRSVSFGDSSPLTFLALQLGIHQGESICIKFSIFQCFHNQAISFTSKSPETSKFSHILAKIRKWKLNYICVNCLALLCNKTGQAGDPIFSSKIFISNFFKISQQPLKSTVFEPPKSLFFLFL